ncbi:MAG: hypothetical protein WA821_04060 [Anaerolineales bacterium]
MTNETISLYSEYLSNGSQLVIMPMSRVHLEYPLTYPTGITFYPAGYLDIADFRVVPNSLDSGSLATAASAATGITQESFDQHPLVVFPAKIPWNTVLKGSHKSHIKLIKSLSDYVEKTLDVVRFHFCQMHVVDTLPGRAGTLDSNPMFSAALLYTLGDHESYIIAGAAFTHIITKGLGLVLEQLTLEDFPQEGEVGKVLQHGLELYSRILEANNNTSKFVQSMSLLEYLAYPDGYKSFTDVAKIIARYIARNSKKYEKLRERFNELTGKRNASGEFIGYRTRIVHIGDRLDDILSNDNDIDALFMELNGYIGIVMTHMLKFSDKTWDEYLQIRNAMQPYNAA